MTRSARAFIAQYLADYAAQMGRPLKPEDKLFAYGWGLDALTKGFQRACQKAGIKDLRLHDLRHTFCTAVAAVVKSPYDLRHFTGHEDFKTLMKYVNNQPSSVADLA
jgi:integrase